MSDQGEIRSETITAEIRMGNENIHFSAEISNEPVHIYDLLPFFQSITNKVVEIGIKEAEAHGKSISCRKGCGACCSQLVPISRAEGFNLLNLIDAMPPDQQQTVKARFNHNMTSLREAGILDVMEQAINSNDRKQLREIGLLYFNLNLPCPFLEEQSCGIHQDRPLSCREFLVVSDPVHCADPDPETVENMVLPKRVSPIVYGMSRKYEEGGRGFLPLTQILEKADELRSDHICEPATDLVNLFLQNLAKP
ncbi:MAG: YkgJ family cysteine cluster protein [Candidatus Thiodiazotropha sp. 6PLUC2]